MYHKYLHNSCVVELACPLLCLHHEHKLGLNFWRKRNTRDGVELFTSSCQQHWWVSYQLTHLIQVSPAQDQQSCLDGHSDMWTMKGSCSRPQRFLWLTVTHGLLVTGTWHPELRKADVCLHRTLLNHAVVEFPKQPNTHWNQKKNGTHRHLFYGEIEIQRTDTWAPREKGRGMNWEVGFTYICAMCKVGD